MALWIPDRGIVLDSGFQIDALHPRPGRREPAWNPAEMPYAKWVSWMQSHGFRLERRPFKHNVVTVAGRNRAKALLFNSAADLEFGFHFLGIGTSATPETQADTALGSEVETRVVATYEDTGDAACILRGDITMTAERTICECAIFDDDSAGNMWNRLTCDPATYAIGAHYIPNMPITLGLPA